LPLNAAIVICRLWVWALKFSIYP